MIELFTLQSHPKDLLNLTAHSRGKTVPPSTLERIWIEQRIIEDNHINNKSLLLSCCMAKGKCFQQIFVSRKHETSNNIQETGEIKS